MAQNSATDGFSVDDYYLSDEDFNLSFLFSETESHSADDQDTDAFPESDAELSERLQLSETLMESSISSADTSSSESSLGLISSDEEIDDVICEICAETIAVNQMFLIQSCGHSFCSDCIRRHIEAKLEENIAAIRCLAAECTAEIELESCRPRIPEEVLIRWDKALCESMILVNQKFYCPFNDCSALLINDGAELVVESECPICRRLFCAQCSVPWHSGIECEEFQKLNEDERGREDIMVKNLAKEENWMRCPQCRFYVARNEGCMHMTCRCGFQFCYVCGKEWSVEHNCERP